jgi:hypothetical protein
LLREVCNAYLPKNDVTSGGKSGIDAVAIACLEANARDARLGEAFSALG